MASFGSYPQSHFGVPALVGIALGVASCAKDVTQGFDGALVPAVAPALEGGRLAEPLGSLAITSEADAAVPPKAALSCRSSTRAQWAHVTVSDPESSAIGGKIWAGDLEKSFDFVYSGQLVTETYGGGVTGIFSITSAEDEDTAVSGQLKLTSHLVPDGDGEPSCPRCSLPVKLNYSFVLELDGFAISGTCSAINL